MQTSNLLVLILSYLIGSIPFGVILGKGMKGKDPRTAGSGNIGFTNVLRVVGPGPAVLTLIADIGKGSLASYIGSSTGGPSIGELSGLFAVLGHCYPVFLKFQGGKAVATGFGALLVVHPLAAAIAVGLWAGVVSLFKYVSLASLVAFGALPLILLWLYSDFNTFSFGLAMGILVFLRHRENILRLWLGTEKKVFG